MRISPREFQLLRLAAAGYTDNQSAEAMGISRTTIHTYWKRLKVKYGSTNRAHLIATILGTEEVVEARIRDDAQKRWHTSIDESSFILDSIKDGILIEDENGMVVATNHAFHRLFPLCPHSLADQRQKAGEVLRECLAGVVDKGSRLLCPEPLGALEIEESGWLTGTKRLQVSRRQAHRSDHTPQILWRFEVQNVPLGVGTDSNLGGSSGVHDSDVSAWKRPDWSEIIDALPVGIVSVSTDGRISLATEIAQSIFELGDEEQGKQASRAFDPLTQPDISRALADALYSKSPSTLKSKWGNDDRWARAFVQPRPWGALIGVADITHERTEDLTMVHLLRLSQLIGNELASMVSAEARSLPSLTQKLVGKLGQFFGARYAKVTFFDANGLPQDPFCAWSSEIRLKQEFLSICRACQFEECWFETLQDKTTVFIEDLAKRRFCTPCDQHFSELGTRQLIVVPIVSDEITRGVIVLETDKAFKVAFDARMEVVLRYYSSAIFHAHRRFRADGQGA